MGLPTRALTRVAIVSSTNGLPVTCMPGASCLSRAEAALPVMNSTDRSSLRSRVASATCRPFGLLVRWLRSRCGGYGGTRWNRCAVGAAVFEN